MTPIPPCRILARDGAPCDITITEREPQPPIGSIRPSAFKGKGSPKLNLDSERIVSMRLSGMSQQAIAEECGCSRQTICKRLTELAKKYPELADVRSWPGPPPSDEDRQPREQKSYPTRPDITPERIAKLKAAGLSMRAIKRELDCSMYTLYARMEREK